MRKPFFYLPKTLQPADTVSSAVFEEEEEDGNNFAQEWTKSDKFLTVDLSTLDDVRGEHP